MGFATTLVGSGYDKVQKIASAEQMNLYEAVENTKKVLQLYRGKLGKNEDCFSFKANNCILR